MIAYVIKSSLSLIVMFGLYWLLLRKEKLFRFNRFFLIFAILFSLVMPFITIPVHIPYNVPEKNIIYAINDNIPTVAPKPVNSQNPPSENSVVLSKIEIEPVHITSNAIMTSTLLMIIYISGAALLLFRFTGNIIYIYRQKQLSDSITYSGKQLVLLDSQVNPFCFMKTIFVHRKDYLENRIGKELLDHEVQHIKQIHTIDIIFFELVQVFYWFNPIIILYNKAARTNHEYLADTAVLDGSVTVKIYADILLNYISHRRNIPLTSGFNQSLTRKRLNMMIKTKSKSIYSVLRISMTLILISVVFLFLGFRQIISQPSDIVFIPYPVYDTIKMMESGRINKYVTYSEGFYISHEVTNREFREFTDWAKNNPNESIYLINDTSAFVKNPKTGKTREIQFRLPKRIDVSQIINEFIVSKAPYNPDNEHQNYFTDERYNEYPVLGVSKRMAEYFCSWKTMKETITKYDTIGGDSVMSSSNEYTYRLPTEKEWDFIAQNYAKKDNQNPGRKEIQRSDETGSKETGILHLYDNVSEWVTADDGKKCIAKGGSWKSGSSISLKQTYNNDNEDETIRFRIVKSQNPKKLSNIKVPIVKDIEGNFYKTVKIGNQIWMAENLKTTRFNDGTIIPLVTDSTKWKDYSPAFCWYNNDEKNYKDKYGALYNWYSVDTKKLCPAGWHVPTSEEVNHSLQNYLMKNGYSYGKDGKEVAKSLASTSGWKSDSIPGRVGNDQSGNNSTGFNAFPVGYRSQTGTFSYSVETEYWWTSSDYNSYIADIWFLASYSSTLNPWNGSKRTGFSVRCVMDNSDGTKRTTDKENMNKNVDKVTSEFSGIWHIKKGMAFEGLIPETLIITQQSNIVTLTGTFDFLDKKPVNKNLSYSLDGKETISRSGEITEKVSANRGRTNDVFIITTVRLSENKGTIKETKYIDTYAINEEGHSLMINFSDNINPQWVIYEKN